LIQARLHFQALRKVTINFTNLQLQEIDDTETVSEPLENSTDALLKAEIDHQGWFLKSLHCGIKK